MNDTMDFYDASRIAVGTGRKIRIGDYGDWSIVLWIDNLTESHITLKEDNGGRMWVPHPKIQQEKVWQVEPDEPKEVFVWASQDSHGTCWMMTDTDGAKLNLPKNSLSRTGQKKYKLVAVEE